MQSLRIFSHPSEEKFNWCPLLSVRLAAFALTLFGVSP